MNETDYMMIVAFFILFLANTTKTYVEYYLFVLPLRHAPRQTAVKRKERRISTATKENIAFWLLVVSAAGVALSFLCMRWLSPYCSLVVELDLWSRVFFLRIGPFFYLAVFFFFFTLAGIASLLESLARHERRLLIRYCSI